MMSTVLLSYHYSFPFCAPRPGRCFNTTLLVLKDQRSRIAMPAARPVRIRETCRGPGMCSPACISRLGGCLPNGPRQVAPGRAAPKPLATIIEPCQTGLFCPRSFGPGICRNTCRPYTREASPPNFGTLQTPSLYSALNPLGFLWSILNPYSRIPKLTPYRALGDDAVLRGDPHLLSLWWGGVLRPKKDRPTPLPDSFFSKEERFLRAVAEELAEELKPSWHFKEIVLFTAISAEYYITKFVRQQPWTRVAGCPFIIACWCMVRSGRYSVMTAPIVPTQYCQCRKIVVCEQLILSELQFPLCQMLRRVC